MKIFIIVALMIGAFAGKAESSNSNQIRLKPKLVTSSSLTEQENKNLAEYINRSIGTIPTSEEGCLYKILKFSPAEIEMLKNLENIAETKIELPGLSTLKHTKHGHSKIGNTDIWKGVDGYSLMNIAFTHYKEKEGIGLSISTQTIVKGNILPTYISMYDYNSLLAVLFFDTTREELGCKKQ